MNDIVCIVILIVIERGMLLLLIGFSVRYCSQELGESSALFEITMRMHRYLKNHFSNSEIIHRGNHWSTIKELVIYSIEQIIPGIFKVNFEER